MGELTLAYKARSYSTGTAGTSDLHVATQNTTACT